jgi:hypothetical protein
MKDIFVFVPDARAPAHRPDVVETWFAPGRLVFIERLVERKFSIEKLFRIPFAYAYMCIRNEQLQTFHVDMLSLFDDRLHSVDMLFSPWLEDLDGPSCARVGLTMERLLKDGLSKRHVKKLWLPMSEWSELFGLDAAALEKLGITHYGEYFPNVAADLGEGGRVCMPTIEL